MDKNTAGKRGGTNMLILLYRHPNTSILDRARPDQKTDEWQQLGEVVRKLLARILTYDQLFVLEEFSIMQSISVQTIEIGAPELL
jgi:hypothetical protein